MIVWGPLLDVAEVIVHREVLGPPDVEERIGLTGGIVPLLMALATAAGFCIAGGQSGINALGGTIYPTFMRATGSGWAFGIGRTGSILGPVIGGYLLGLSLTTPQLFAFVAAPALCAAGALFLLGYVAGRFPQDSEGGTPVIRVDRH